jgi:diguanylate cyclase (GGDEF)-like protein
MLRAESRQSDLVGRLGGEEFALLAPETPLEAAQTVASRIAEACRRLIVAAPAGDVRSTCSIGLSAMAPDDEDLESVLRRADGAMYDAKRSGRDRWRSR